MNRFSKIRWVAQELYLVRCIKAGYRVDAERYSEGIYRRCCVRRGKLAYEHDGQTVRSGCKCLLHTRHERV